MTLFEVTSHLGNPPPPPPYDISLSCSLSFFSLLQEKGTFSDAAGRLLTTTQLGPSLQDVLRVQDPLKSLTCGRCDIVTVVADGRQMSGLCRENSEKFTGTCQKWVGA